MNHATELLFDGRIPAEFSMVENDVTSVQIPSPYFALLSRMSYLSLETAEVINHFKGSVIEFEQSIWFECDGKPMRSNLPIGVLFDLHAPKNSSLPWKIVIHFRHFPGTQLIRFSTPSESHKLLAHSMKQAVFLLSGNTRLFTSLSIQKQADLHMSVDEGNCRVYREVMKEVVSGISMSSARSLPVAIVFSDGRPVLRRPVSVYIADPSLDVRSSDSKTADVIDCTVITGADISKQQGAGEPELSNVSGDSEDSSERNTDDVDVTLAEEKMNEERDSVQQSKGRVTTLHDVISSACVDADINFTKIREIIIQGISLPPDVSIFDIWDRFCHLDLFLYIVVHLASIPAAGEDIIAPAELIVR